MAELLFNNLLSIFYLFFQLELFFSICFNNLIFFNKHLNIFKSRESQQTLIKNSTNFSFFNFFVLSLIFLKADNINYISLILVLSILIIFLDKILYQFSMFSKFFLNFYNLILPLILSLLYFLTFVNSFLTFFFFIELYGVFYYFSFLTSYSNTNQSLLKYKNGLLLLLWNNFLTTLFLALGCYFITIENGTTNFFELNLLKINCIYIYIYLVGVTWKLGLPGFQFFKLEIYKYLIRENVFFFSIITTVINLTLFYFIISQAVVFNTIYLHNYLVIPFIFTINLVIINLKLYSILHYFALSSVLTMSTILSIFLIK